ncbi:MAG: tetratricopeptide repeat protein [Proteobacteria bacterium]|nr:tetratricopeptide repeat protein [Pseudomonadota bacterium]
MFKFQKACVLLLLLSLISCGDKSAAPDAISTQAKDDNSQSFQNIDFAAARQFESQADFASLSSRADQYFEAGQYQQAIITYDQALGINPMCADCLNDKGLALFYAGDPLAALESIDKAIATDPGYTHAWLSKGFILVSAGRYQQAIAPLNKVKQLDGSGTLAKEADKFLALIAERNPQ